jgi:hypothetical protein
LDCAVVCGWLAIGPWISKAGRRARRIELSTAHTHTAHAPLQCHLGGGYYGRLRGQRQLVPRRAADPMSLLLCLLRLRAFRLQRRHEERAAERRRSQPLPRPCCCCPRKAPNAARRGGWGRAAAEEGGGAPGGQEEAHHHRPERLLLRTGPKPPTTIRRLLLLLLLLLRPIEVRLHPCLSDHTATATAMAAAVPARRQSRNAADGQWRVCLCVEYV